MAEGTRIWATLVAVLMLALLAGCGDDDDDEGERPAPVAGNFVGKVRGTDAFVAVRTAPARRGQRRRGVDVYVSDGRRLSESLRGSLSDNSFTATSDDDDSEARGELARDGVTGTVKLPGRSGTVRFQASRATGGSGLYDLTVSRRGALRGTSAAGLLLKGNSSLPRPGKGSFKLVDGSRLRFTITRATSDDSIRARSGQVRLIVLPAGELRGAGKSQAAAGGRDGFFIRSSK